VEEKRERVDKKETVLPVGRKRKTRQGEEKQRKREVEFSQGLMRNFRKLQGPVCKTKFPVDLKHK
jgi:hypothetical protein